MYSPKNRHPGKLHRTFFPLKKSALLSLLKDVEPLPDRKMIKLLRNLKACFCHYDLLTKTCGRMTMAIAFSFQDDAGSRVSTSSIKKSCRHNHPHCTHPHH